MADIEYHDLAIRTEQWMRDIGAVWISKTETSGEIPRHMTVHEWAEQFDIALDDKGEPTWESGRVWQHVKLEMILDGIPIALHVARGHYIGEPGNQASNVIFNVAHAMARLQTAMSHLDAVKESGEWIDVLEKMKGKLIPERLLLLLDQTPGVIPERYAGVLGDELRLLMSGKDENE